jgi:hypothetical protein
MSAEGYKDEAPRYVNFSILLLDPIVLLSTLLSYLLLKIGDGVSQICKTTVKTGVFIL